MVRIVMTLANHLILLTTVSAMFSIGKISKTQLPELEIFVMFLLSKKLTAFTREINFFTLLTLNILKTVVTYMWI